MTGGAALRRAMAVLTHACGTGGTPVARFRAPLEPRICAMIPLLQGRNFTRA